MIDLEQKKVEELSRPLINQLCRFRQFDAKQQAEQIRQKLADARSGIAQKVGILAAVEAASLTRQQAQDLLFYLDQTEMDIHHLLSPLRHLHNVAQTSAIRSIYQDLLPLLSEYTSWLSQHEGLYRLFVRIMQADYFTDFSVARKADIQRSIRDFQLAGVDLAEDKKQRLRQIHQRLDQLSTDFSNHVLDATQSWQLHVTDIQQLQGLPEHQRAYLREQAQKRDLSGYLLTLDAPAYQAIMLYADHRPLRQKVYTAFAVRASDQGDHPAYDNTQIMQEILTLRQQLATLSGLQNYAEYALQTRMAGSVSQVLDFLQQLADSSLPQGKKEFQELTRFAQKISPELTKLEPWDIAYYSQKLRQQTFSLNPEQLRPYFPLNKVLAGISTMITRLFGVYLLDITDQVDVYHPDVRFVLLYNKERAIGGIYLDLFARQGKRGGAWMDDYYHYGCSGTHHYLPVAFLAANFTPPSADKPALLLHEEVETLLHELGHSLHHILTSVDVFGASGINHVAWDAVELPSQLLENWCWQKEGLDLLAAHDATGESIPAAWLQQLTAAKTFQSAMQMLRQLEFALFDMQIHSRPHKQAISKADAADGADIPDPHMIMQTLAEVRKAVRVTPVDAQDRFPQSFSHIFAGGYAAGYYSYKWAEVLSADVFSRFQQQGILDAATGRSFLEHILAQGSSKPMQELFKNFMGRDPDIQALLKQYGLA